MRGQLRRPGGAPRRARRARRPAWSLLPQRPPARRRRLARRPSPRSPRSRPGVAEPTALRPPAPSSSSLFLVLPPPFAPARSTIAPTVQPRGRWHLAPPLGPDASPSSATTARPQASRSIRKVRIRRPRISGSELLGNFLWTLEFHPFTFRI